MVNEEDSIDSYDFCFVDGLARRPITQFARSLIFMSAFF